MATKKPSKPSNVTIDRLNNDKDMFRVKWKKATQSGDSAVSSIKVTWWYQKYNDKSDVWHQSPKSGKEYPLAKDVTSHDHKFDSVDSASSSIKKVKAKVTFHNSEGNATSSDIMTLYPASAPSIAWNTAGGSLQASISFPSDTDTMPLHDGSKSNAASWKITKQAHGSSTVTTVESRAKKSSTPADRTMKNISGATLSPADGKAYRYEITATIDGVVKYQKSDKSWGTDKTVTSHRYVAKPNAPTISSVSSEGHSYTVKWTYDNESGWRPADTYEVSYADIDQSSDDEPQSWTSLADGLTAKSYTATIDGAIPDGMKRCFMVKAKHYGIESDYAIMSLNSMWGTPEPPTISVATNEGGNIVTVTAGAKCADTAWVYAYRVQGGKTVEVKRFCVKDGMSVVFEDKPGTGTYYYTAKTVNTGKGNKASELAYSSTIITPIETVFKRWAKDDGCETAYLEWSDPDPNKNTVIAGYEVAWGESPDAFDSNKKPSTMTVENRATTQCRISDLEPGETYWFWIRTISLSGDGMEYKSNWTNGYKDESGFHTASLMMANSPDEPGISLSSDYVIKGGDSLTVGWTYTSLGDAPQTAWSVTLQGDGEPLRITSNDEGCSAEDASATFDTSALPQGQMTCFVTVENVNGSATASAPFAVAVIPKATISPQIHSICTELPVYCTIHGDADNPEGTTYSIEVENVRGISQQLPNGERVQYDGQNVGTFQEAWTFETGDEGTIRAPNLIYPDLIDGGHYRLRVVSTDPNTGLSSATDWSDFAVDWSLKSLEAGISVGASTEYEAAARIYTNEACPDGFSMSVWRATQDGVTLAIEDADYFQEYIDMYAPFGETHYRASVRTPDGVISFTDWAVTIPCEYMRIDFGAEHVELTYNITNGDSRDSGDEVKRFLDGSKAAITKRGTNRTQSLTAVLERKKDTETLERLYSLSRYDGICFVRTPDGMAYPAIVKASIDMDSKSPLANVSIECVEVDDEGQFLATITEDEVTA